ncbi:MAG: hypothetical protein ISN26_02970 [Betaproteobacteria bacterium AqS2]|uniref:Uncharacterized protein n=1 Tax=Candidatus Amphirhobacter heronislandensis TaxID=1732024 RepID=A0A930XWF6_9GAMM|nr:hypothetical protein [Betaproteobacteria bacterium AqS2]
MSRALQSLASVVTALRFVASAVCQLLGVCLLFAAWQLWGVDGAHAFRRSLPGLAHYQTALLFGTAFTALALLLLPVGRLRAPDSPSWTVRLLNFVKYRRQG